MDYRANHDQRGGSHADSTLRDVFDSSHYREVLRERVVVNGETLNHRFFSDPLRRCIASQLAVWYSITLNAATRLVSISIRVHTHGNTWAIIERQGIYRRIQIPLDDEDQEREAAETLEQVAGE